MGTLQVKSLEFINKGPYDLTVNSCQCACITGVSGSGKTLLLRSIADLDPHKGEVYLDRIEAKELKAFVWRRRVGMLPAESKWWADQVDDHFESFNTHYLHQLGFESDVMNWEVRRLSTGERQRLAIIRLLGNKPKALLLDEPTASLDSDNVTCVEELIKSYAMSENIPVLWVSHDPDQVKRLADRHLILTQKQLLESTL